MRLIETAFKEKVQVDQIYLRSLEEKDFETMGAAIEQRVQLNKKILDLLVSETPVITEPEIRPESESYPELLEWMENKRTINA